MEPRYWNAMLTFLIDLVLFFWPTHNIEPRYKVPRYVSCAAPLFIPNIAYHYRADDCIDPCSKIHLFLRNYYEVYPDSGGWTHRMVDT